MTESLLLVTMLYFVMPNFCLEMWNTTLPFSILLKHLSGYCLMSGYIFECI